jgi:hypothetical protein
MTKIKGGVRTPPFLLGLLVLFTALFDWFLSHVLGPFFNPWKFGESRGCHPLHPSTFPYPFDS